MDHFHRLPLKIFQKNIYWCYLTKNKTSRLFRFSSGSPESVRDPSINTQNCQECKSAAAMENSSVVPKKVKHVITIQTRIDMYPPKLKTGTQTNTCTHMFIAELFTIAKRWKQPKRPSTDEWIKKMQYIHTMEYYSAIKKEQNSAICSNIEIIMQ